MKLNKNGVIIDAEEEIVFQIGYHPTYIKIGNNGKLWGSAITANYSKGGVGHPLMLSDFIYKTREDARQAGIKDIKDFMERSRSDFNNNDDRIYNEWLIKSQQMELF
jgi:hypothetical protein